MPSRGATLNVGLVLFPNLTQLDLTGPYEVIARMPRTTVHLMAATAAPVRSEHGLTMTPTRLFANGTYTRLATSGAATVATAPSVPTVTAVTPNSGSSAGS